jgi:hypothetical protein
MGIPMGIMAEYPPHRSIDELSCHLIPIPNTWHLCSESSFPNLAPDSQLEKKKGLEMAKSLRQK